MDNLLFESKGAPAKRKKTIRNCSIGAIICGILLLLICQKIAEGLALWGAIAIIAGIIGLIFCNNDFADKSYLQIYDDRVTGRQLSPDSVFELKYDQIYNVKKANLISNEFLVIEGKTESYSVLVNDLDAAYRIINNKLDELEKI